MIKVSSCVTPTRFGVESGARFNLPPGQNSPVPDRPGVRLTQPAAQGVAPLLRLRRPVPEPDSLSVTGCCLRTNGRFAPGAVI
jgi:hypothetical protein